MHLKTNVLTTTAAALLIGSAGLSSQLAPRAAADMGHHVGPTGNIVEMADPGKSTYIPDVAGASHADRMKARALLDGANRFCRTHSAARLEATWTRGSGATSHPTHFFNPHPGSLGLHPMNPRAALIYNGRLDGVMLTGMPLPYLGSIPRAHTHSGMRMNVEMVHVYCTKSLVKAFTPNRTLGVRAPLIELRKTVRPAIMDLGRHQLHQVRATVRDYAGKKLKAVHPVRHPSGRGPKPVVLAMQKEIRKSLMILTQHQLRQVWSLMRSY